MGFDIGGSAPWWVAGGAVAGAIVLKTIDWFYSRRKERTETDANVELLNQLRQQVAGMADRMQTMEASHDAFRARLEDEIKLRMQAQEESHRLRLRVQTLEAAMRSIGAVIPPEANP